MMPLVEIGRSPAGDDDILCRRLDEIVCQAGGLVGDRIAVELGPTRVVMGNDVEHQVIGPDRLEAVVAECACELPGESRMLVHHDGQAGLSWGRGLNDHRQAPPTLPAGFDASPRGVRLCASGTAAARPRSSLPTPDSADDAL